MEIEIIKIQPESCELDATIQFGIFLKKVQSILHLLHWYSKNYNVHEILGNLYETLDKKFDKLQEEIIGTSRENNVLFPSFSPFLDIDNIEQYKGNIEDTILNYKILAKCLQDILTSIEFKNYTNSINSGINNTVDDVLTALNKANYLLSMVQY
jgi:DNA-binding ferritin-like protein